MYCVYFSEAESWSNHEDEATGQLVAHKKGTEKPAASSTSANSDNPEAGSRKWPNIYYISPAVVSHMETVCSIIRKIYGQSPTDDFDDLNVNTAIWGIFMNTTLRAAIHLGQHQTENLLFTKNQHLKSAKQLLQATDMLIKDQTEINALTTIDYKDLTWRSTSLLCDKTFAITNAKTYVFADSVLCLESMRDEPNVPRKNNIKWYFEKNHLKDLNRIDGKPTEFEWKLFPGFTMLGILEEIQTIYERSAVFQRQDHLHVNVQRHCMVRRRNIAVVGHSWDLDQKRNGTELTLINLTESGKNC